MAEDVFVSPKKKGKIAMFISGRGSNFQAIHDAILAGKINAEIALVFSNKKDAPGLQIAKERNLETLFLDPKAYPSREDHEKAVTAELRKRDVDLVILAGYMRILSPSFCEELKHCLMNIHPALLPSFPGLHGQRQAWEYGVKVSGCTVHLVDLELDHGPIVVQRMVPVLSDDTEEVLSARILEQEHVAYPEALRALLGGVWRIDGRRVVFP